MKLNYNPKFIGIILGIIMFFFGCYFFISFAEELINPICAYSAHNFLKIPIAIFCFSYAEILYTITKNS